MLPLIRDARFDAQPVNIGTQLRYSIPFASLRRTLRAFLAVAILPVGVATVTSCGDDGSGPPAAADGGAPDAVPLENSLADFLPPLPEPTGAARAVFAGPITSANAAAEIPPGPASTGLVGDLFVRNARAKFVIQAASPVEKLNRKNANFAAR